MEWEAVGQDCLLKALEALKNFKAAKTFDNGINPHTDADMVAHNAMVSALEKSGLPCDLVSEEFNEKIKINGGGDTRVFIDPIDGTAHFMRGELAFCGIGLFTVENGQPEYSFVADVATGDIYHCDSRRAYKNGGPMAIPEKILGKHVLAGWAPYSPRIEIFFEKISKLPRAEYIAFNFGEMLQSAKIIDGRYDACFEIMPAKLQEFAGAIIAWRAGGELTTMEGNPIVWDVNVKQTMLVSRDKELHQKLLTAFNA